MDEKNAEDEFILETLEKFHESVHPLLEALKKDKNIGRAIDNIFENSDNIQEIEAKIALLFKEYIRDIESEFGPELQRTDIKGHAVAKHLIKLGRDFITKIQGEAQGAQNDAQASENKNHNNLSAQAKRDFQKIVKNFVVYKVYQVMNPRRIAGETKIDNYKNNYVYRGKDYADNHVNGIKPLSKREEKTLDHARSSFVRGRTIIGR